MLLAWDSALKQRKGCNRSSSPLATEGISSDDNDDVVMNGFSSEEQIDEHVEF